MSKNLKRQLSALLFLAGVSLANPANACPDGELQFNFSNLKVIEAYAILANFSGLKPEIDHSLTQSEAMKFGCTPWRVVANDLAERHNLKVTTVNGILRVSRK